MREKPTLLLVASCLAVASGCFRSGGSPIGVPLREATQFESEWRGYQRLTGLKALAVAGDLNGVYVSGFAWAYPVQELANEEALESCEERRGDRGVQDVCQLYAVGDETAQEAEAD